MLTLTPKGCGGTAYEMQGGCISVKSLRQERWKIMKKRG